MGGGSRLCVIAALAVAACGEPGPGIDHEQFALDAFCEATVSGVGVVDVETDYLAGVVNCENGGADFEALKAQAVSARSYLYYKLERSGEIGDGTGDQVFSCGREPGQQHYDAVAETSGLVLRYLDTQVAAFYVAGALQQGPACVGGTDDPTNTEMYVTYNEGKSGDGIDQTPLGFISPGNYANRGCLSQNGSNCLSMAGREFDSILRFYYGEDIELVQAEGPCVFGDTGPDAGPGDPADPMEPGVREAQGGCSSSGSATLLGLGLVVVAVARLRRRPAAS